MQTKKQIVFWLLFFVAFSLVVYGVWVESFDVSVTHLWIQEGEITKALKGRLAIHLSDLHIRNIGNREKNVLRLIEELRPDIIFMTGDYVQWNGNYESAIIFLSKLKARIGVWAVMGDYDYSCSRKSCLFCHEPGTGEVTNRHTVHFLKNTLKKISLPLGYILIGGMDAYSEYPLVDRNFGFIANNEPVILLSHSPLTFDLIDNNKNLLMLSGDTHGGQIPLPSWLWKFLGYEKNARYNQGFFQEGKKKMYVSRGIGTSHLPIRIFEKPELIVIHF